MFHLSVPSAQTQQWLVFCRENGYLFSQAGILDLGEGQRGIPLLDSAPPQGSECWQGNSIVEAEGRVKGPTHWSERLPGDLQKLEWPNSYEIQGDLLIVKLEEELIPHEKAMAEAMLTQLPNIRLVCADEGVKGEFRVRDLRPILARDDNMSTMTRIRENGYSLWVDPAQVYFSIRLSNERIGTLEAGKKLANELDRPIVVADPYAGVGPSIAALLSQEGLLSGCYAGDLNPAAHELLEKNISGEGLEPFILRCADATKWSEREVADLLLVNLPHDSIDHLPHVLPLLKRQQTVVLRGWAIVERENMEESRQRIVDCIEGEVFQFEFEEIKGFSTSKCFACFEVWFKRA